MNAACMAWGGMTRHQHAAATCADHEPHMVRCAVLPAPAWPDLPWRAAAAAWRAVTAVARIRAPAARAGVQRGARVGPTPAAAGAGAAAAGAGAAAAGAGAARSHQPQPAGRVLWQALSAELQGSGPLAGSGVQRRGISCVAGGAGAAAGRAAAARANKPEPAGRAVLAGDQRWGGGVWCHAIGARVAAWWELCLHARRARRRQRGKVFPIGQ